jgi:hypothetical protein
MLLTLHRYTLDDDILSNVTDSSIYWARLDSIVMTWILGTLSSELHEIIQEPSETARQVWLVIVTPRVIKILIKFLKMQLSPNTRLNQDNKVWNQIQRQN